jgi:hypothetical protein
MATTSLYKVHVRPGMYIKFAFILLLLLLLVCTATFQWGNLAIYSTSPSNPLTIDVHGDPPAEVSDNSVIDVFDDPPLDSEAVKSLCTKTEWNPHLVFTCSNNGGGIGNVRNSILICIRHSIAAGAGLVIPQILLRKPDDITDIWTKDRAPFSYMFDLPHLVDSLRISCPGLILYSSEDEIGNFTNATRHDLHVEDIASKPFFFARASMVDRPELWPHDFSSWLEKTKLVSTAESPLIIDLVRSYLSYPVYSDGKEFAESFGGVLKFRSDARILATKVLSSLLNTSGIPLDISTPFQQNAFLGAHLRTEFDAQKSWGNSYDTQLDSYVKQALSTSLPLIYLTSGDLSEATKFTNDVQPHNLKVTTKHDLLSGGDKEELLALTWDQQALVDYLVMLKASSFAGSGTSSFSWNIGLWRHIFARHREHLNGPQPLSDELSQVYGLYPRQYPQYDTCMWP